MWCATPTTLKASARTSDQAGNVYETDYDLAGRQTQRRVTTLASGFNGAIRRIETAYDSLDDRLVLHRTDAIEASPDSLASPMTRR